MFAHYPHLKNSTAFTRETLRSVRDRLAGRLAGSSYTDKITLISIRRRPQEGLALFTPEDLYTGQFEATWRVRQAAMDRHYAAHPERYVKGPPQVARPPAVVSINPDDGQTAAELLGTPDALKVSPTPVSIELPEVVT